VVSDHGPVGVNVTTTRVIDCEYTDIPVILLLAQAIVICSFGNDQQKIKINKRSRQRRV
jgi:hypothetical protein